MIDTGATPNVVKKRSLHSQTPIAHDDPLYLSGITNGRVETLGSVEISLLGHPVNLHVVPDNFPIAQEGILGSEFLRDASNINFKERCLEWHGIQIPFAQRETIVVPARSQTTFFCRIENPNVTIGYLPRLRVCDDVYIGEAVVTNRDGKAYLRITNSSEEDKEIVVPTLPLEEIEEISVNGPRTKAPANQLADIKYIQYQSQEQRAERVKHLLRLQHLNDEESRHVNKLIHDYSDLFQLPDEQLACTNIVSHRIHTKDEQPVNIKQYRFPPAHKSEINTQVEKMLDNKVIKTSTSPYNSPLWIVPKKPDSKGNKKWRLVIDFRALNEKTLGDAYPLPNITDILDQLGSAKYFSIFDLASGFHQIPMSEHDAHKTAFSTPYGHYEFERMPFGLKNAPATFQRLMDRVLSGLQGIELFVYLDDIVIYASSLTEHNRKFNKLAERLRNANLRLQPDKCEFLRKEVSYLGHTISEQGIKPDPNKISAVKNFPRPKNAKNIKQFLGLAGYYRRFLPKFSNTVKPLTALLQKDQVFKWQEPQENAFVTLRDQLCEEPILQHPDFTRPFVLTTDASGYAIGGILSQGELGKDKPIAYASRLLNKAEQNYSTIEKESLAIVYCTNHFRPYLYGNRFTIVTDHKPLEWLHSVKDPTSRLIRWRLKLAEYDYKITYKAGKTNCNADALSRNPAQGKMVAEGGKIIKVRGEHMYPLSLNDTDDESIFDALPRPNISCEVPRKKTIEKNYDVSKETEHGHDNRDILRNVIEERNSNTVRDTENKNMNIQLPSEINDNLAHDISDSDITVNELDSGTEDEELFDNPNPTFLASRFSAFNISRENIIARKDHIVIFVDTKGAPCDTGAVALQKAGLLPVMKELTQGRARPITHGKKYYIIALVVETKTSILIQRELIKESMSALTDAIAELGLNSFTIAKGSIGDVPWESLHQYVHDALYDTGLNITICTNEVTIPPETERNAIISEYHASAIGGHKGITKTFRRIRDRYYWPRMKFAVEEFIKNCRNCQLKKLVRRKVRQPMVLTDTPDTAFDKISMDIMGPLSATANDNSYILTIQDLLTKYSLAIPLKHAGAVDVAEALTNEFICIYGAPKALLTDQGTHFINSLLRAIARKFKISHFTTTAYRPQANGSVERSHHVLWEYLKLIATGNKDWDAYLKTACFSYNTSVHEGTNYTPYELVFGKSARLPTSDPHPEDTKNESYDEYLTNLYNRLRDVQVAAKINLRAAKERSKKYYDKRMNPYNFKLGDKVLLLKEPTNKLSDQYIGPCTITEILQNNNVRISIDGKKTIRTVHSDKLKPLPTHRRTTRELLHRPSEEAVASTSIAPDQQP